MLKLKLVLVAALLLMATLAYGQTTTTGNQRRIPTYQVTINSNVRSASIYVDGVLQRERAPATLDLQAGVYDIRVEFRGYLSWTQTINVRSRMNLQANLRLPYATVILDVPREYLNFDIRNPQSQILFYIDDELVRTNTIQVDPGNHRVAIASGGLRLEGNVYFEAGMDYTLELILRLNLIQNLQLQSR